MLNILWNLRILLWIMSSKADARCPSMKYFEIQSQLNVISFFAVLKEFLSLTCKILLCLVISVLIDCEEISVLIDFVAHFENLLNWKLSQIYEIILILFQFFSEATPSKSMPPIHEQGQIFVKWWIVNWYATNMHICYSLRCSYTWRIEKLCKNSRAGEWRKDFDCERNTDCFQCCLANSCAMNFYVVTVWWFSTRFFIKIDNGWLKYFYFLVELRKDEKNSNNKLWKGKLKKFDMMVVFLWKSKANYTYWQTFWRAPPPRLRQHSYLSAGNRIMPQHWLATDCQYHMWTHNLHLFPLCHVVSSLVVAVNIIRLVLKIQQSTIKLQNKYILYTEEKIKIIYY